MPLTHETHRRPDIYLGDEPNPRVTSVAVLVHTGHLGRGGHCSFLLVEQLDVEGHPFGIPGGRTEPFDKTPADSALREVEEETGLLLQTDNLTNFTHVKPIPQLSRTEVTRLVYSYKVSQSELGPMTYDSEWGIYHLERTSPRPEEIGEMVLVPANSLFRRDSRYVPTYRWDIMHWVKADLKGMGVV